MFFAVQAIEKTQVETTLLYIVMQFLMCLFYMGGRLVLYIGRTMNEGVWEQSAEDDIYQQGRK
jgi:hypothetical protein